MATTDTILAHWPWIIAAWVLVGLVTGMPSPGKDGPTSSWWYRWLYGSLHLTIGAIPRIIATLFPQYSKLIPGMNGGTNGTSKTDTSPASGPIS